MTEEKIPRTCIACNKKRRTTVQPEERKVYICEYCLRGKIYDEAVKGLKGSKGILTIALLVGFGVIVGWILSKVF